MRPCLTPLLLCLLTAGSAAAESTLSAVTVTASGTAEDERREAVTQKVVLERKEIEALGGLSVNEVIRKLPGIDAGAHSGDGGPSANARGMGRDAVQFLVDGERPSANARYALTTVGRLPAGELERIEILRGASAEHGGAAPVTVNLVMRKARPQSSTTVKAALGMRGDQPNGQFTLSQGGGEQGFSWILPLTLNHHGMPQEKTVNRQVSGEGGQREREKSPYRLDELVLSPRLTWRDGEGSVSVWPSLYHHRGERNVDVRRWQLADPSAGGAMTDAGGRREEERTELTIARIRLEGERKSASGKWSGRAAAMQARRQQDIERWWESAGGGVTSGLERNRRQDQEFSSALRLDQAQGEGMLALGIEQAWHRREERQALSGAAAGEHGAEARQWTGWVQREWLATPALTLTAGLRGEWLSLQADRQQGGLARQESQLAPSLAVRFGITPAWILRSSLGAGIKAPKLEEISGLTLRGAGYNSPVEADRAGNPALRAERNVNWELALDHHLPPEIGTLGANIYFRRTVDFIERRAALEAGRWVERPYNEGRARHWGLELDARLRGDVWGWPGLALRTHLTLPRARVEDRRLGIDRAARELPRYQWTLGLDQSLPDWQASAGFQLVRHGEVRTEVPGEWWGRQGGRTLLDVYAVRRLTAQSNLRLEMQNLLAEPVRRSTAAWEGNAANGGGTAGWLLDGRERGQRALLLSLEGKW